jgi:hypothetical protein
VTVAGGPSWILAGSLTVVLGYAVGVIAPAVADRIRHGGHGAKEGRRVSIEREEWSDGAIIRAAGELTKRGRQVQVARWVVQQWSDGNKVWMDGPSEYYHTEPEALEREIEISEWEHVGRTRVVHRVVTVTETSREDSEG